MDSVTSAINKTIYDSISIYTNTLIDNGLLNCSFDTAISHFSFNTSNKKKKSKPEVIKSLPMWTPHHFDTCIALVGDCMAQCSLSKTQGQFCTACSKKCGEDGIPPNGTIFTRTSYQYTAPNGKSPKPFIDSTIYKKKIKDGESPAQIRQYYEDLHFEISPLNWGDHGPIDTSNLNQNDDDDMKSSKKSSKNSDDDEKSKKSSKNSDDKSKNSDGAAQEKSSKKSSKNSDGAAEEKKYSKKNNGPAEVSKNNNDKKSIKKNFENNVDHELTADIPDIPNSFEWNFQGIDYLAINLPGGDKNIYDFHSHEHIGIFNSRSNRLIKY